MPTAAAPAPSADELDTGMKKATEGTEKDKVGQNDDPDVSFTVKRELMVAIFH